MKILRTPERKFYAVVLALILLLIAGYSTYATLTITDTSMKTTRPFNFTGTFNYTNAHLRLPIIEPSNPTAGSIYLNTTDGKVYVYNTSWIALN